MNRQVFALIGVLVVSVGSIVCHGQVTTGSPTFNSFSGDGPDIVNIGNLNDHWTFPITSRAGRGQNFLYDLIYDSSLWYPMSTGSTTLWEPVAGYGWGGGVIPVGSTYVLYSVTTQQGSCGQYGTGTWQSWTYNNFVYRDLQGTNHPLEGDIVDISSSGGTGCPSSGVSPALPSTFPATDNSGLHVTVTSAGENSIAMTLTSRSGLLSNVPVIANNQSAQGAYTLTDRNGNEISYDGNGHFTDTLGVTALTLGNAPPSDVTFSFTNPSGTQSSYTVAYTSYTLQTHFHCGNTVEFTQPNTFLPTLITLPDGRDYRITYEQTPTFGSGYTTGRISQIVLPTGGTVSYTYTSNGPGQSNGIVCADGSTSGLTRTITGGTNSSQWAYTRSGSGTQWATTITTPTYTNAQLNSEQDQTVVSFLTSAAGPYTQFYEISRRMYSGLQTSLMQTLLTCYVSTSCSSSVGDTDTSITNLISWRQHTVQMGGVTARAYGSQELFNGYGLLTQKIDFDFGANGAFGNPLRQTTVAYASLANGVNNMPSQVTTMNGSGTTTYSETQYIYDQGSPSITSGTPQHRSGINSGNLTTLIRSVSGGATLTSSYTYFDTGNVNTATDVNGAQTTYAYSSAGCANSFLTQTSYPVDSLTRKASWNCTGAVETSSTDTSGNATLYEYNDQNYWRVTTTEDPWGNPTSQTYPTGINGSNTSESVTNFNGANSTTDLVTQYDGLGRAELAERRQSPGSSSFFISAVSYDALGRLFQASLPYSGAAGTDTLAPGTTTYYDPIGRTASVVDSGAGDTTYTYDPGAHGYQNDVLVTVGPAPSGENSKRRQLEYDAIGRLSQVCEVTSAAGSGACSEGDPIAGYWTMYSYDPAGNLLNVQQNAQTPGQTQSRTFTHDWLGRITSQTIPESGTTTYTYDSDTSLSNCGTSVGDLVKLVDNNGNITCIAYDAMHRQTKVWVATGSPYLASTPAEYYVYDSASLNGVAMRNVGGRLAEAYTCMSTCGAAPSSSHTTDAFFSYFPQNGNSQEFVAQVYEMTPASNPNFYLTQDTYWLNGAPANITASLNGASIGVPSVNYGVGGGGRLQTAHDATNNLSLTTSVNYDPAGDPTQIDFGNSDFDSFQYDSNTLRPTQFKYTVTGASSFTVTGGLQWNANWSLNQLTITDTNDSAKNQICTYGADDLQRTDSVNCVNNGSTVWTQTFTYDPFGNIKKTGNIQSYLAQYGSPYNNQVTGGVEFAYDKNGNQTESATGYLFSWNAYGQPWSVNGVTATYDALGRMVESTSGGQYNDFIYRPTGDKLAEVSGSTLVQAWLPLPGGETAMYNGGGFNYFRHVDWLASSRLATTWGHAIHSKEAYAPFGEPYNEISTTDRSFTGDDQTTVQGGSNAQGLYDFLFRRNDPAAGRWLSPDPDNGSYVLADPQSFNRYTYAENKPLARIDSLGLDVDSDAEDNGEEDFVCYDTLNCWDDFNDELGGDLGGGGEDDGGDYMLDQNNNAWVINNDGSISSGPQTVIVSGSNGSPGLIFIPVTQLFTMNATPVSLPLPTFTVTFAPPHFTSVLQQVNDEYNECVRGLTPGAILGEVADQGQESMQNKEEMNGISMAIGFMGAVNDVEKDCLKDNPTADLYSGFQGPWNWSAVY